MALPPLPDRKTTLMLVTLLLASGLAGVLPNQLGQQGSLLPAFRDFAELSSYISSLHQTRGSDGWGFGMSTFGGPPAAPGTQAGSADYSSTNVQVSGVDEGDIVKTDGQVLYLAGARGVKLVRASPPSDMGVIAAIDLRNLTPEDLGARAVLVNSLLITPGRLVVVASGQRQKNVQIQASSMIPVMYEYSGVSILSIFDVSNPESPRRIASVAVSGSPKATRMIGGYSYVVSEMPIIRDGEGYALPQVCQGSNCGALEAQSIHYDPEAQDASSFVNVVAMEVAGGRSMVTTMITSSYSVVYMSPGALYLSFRKVGRGMTKVLSGLGPDPGEALTTVYRIGIDGLRMRASARGDVPGSVLNQFSFDEFEGFLRVATTTGQVARGGGTARTNVFILDETLGTVGALQGLAPGETVHSARFVGERGYLVTFKKVDPLFVLDLSNPREPQVLGFLKVPGYSEYMHPIDRDHILGVGKDTVEASGGGFAWYQGLKVSLFDVSDPSNPKELSSYDIGDRGTASEVLSDHRSLLYIPREGLVVLPVDLAIIDPARYDSQVPPYAYGEPVWQGAYVLAVNASEGITLRGRITHFGTNAFAPYSFSPLTIRRALYIGNFLYTVSRSVVKVNALGDLSEIASLVYEPWSGSDGSPWPQAWG